MSTSPYDIGDRPTIRCLFVDSDGAAADPTGITFKIKAPDNEIDIETEANATNPAVGEWRWPIPGPFDVAGTWYVRVEGTSGLQTAEELTLEVGTSQF